MHSLIKDLGIQNCENTPKNKFMILEYQKSIKTSKNSK